MTKYDLTLTYAEGQTKEGVCTIERSYPKVGKVGVGQILKRYLEYFSSYIHFSKLKRSLNMGLNEKVYSDRDLDRRSNGERDMCY